VPAPVTDWLSEPGLPMPAERLMGVRVLEAVAGRASGSQDFLDPGTVSLGWFGVLADTMSGRPVACSMAPGQSLSTVSMHLDLVRAPTPADCAGVAGAGRLIELSRSWALSEVTVTGAGSRRLVLGSVRFMVHASQHSPELPLTNGAGHLDRSPDLRTRLGLQVEHAADGRAGLSFMPTEQHTNPYPMVHGGLHAALVDAALTAAVGSTPSGDALSLLTLDLNYHRPIRVGPDRVRIEALVLQQGRRTAVAEATVRNAEGKALTSARGGFGRW
jgi:uncharacterized protein (TIGR00369 family)